MNENQEKLGDSLRVVINKSRKTPRARKRLRKNIKKLWAKWGEKYYSLKEQKKRHEAIKAENVRYVTQFGKKLVEKHRIAGSVGMAPKIVTNKFLMAKS